VFGDVKIVTIILRTKTSKRFNGIIIKHSKNTIRKRYSENIVRKRFNRVKIIVRIRKRKTIK